jgi:gamma-glutamylcyclotransferase (GGCT)/AIG2-like uncharacterized protein YtfP
VNDSAEPVAAELVAVEHLFVYGTLRPGEVRWHHLEPFVVGDGVDTSTAGVLFDTGHGYPAAVFGDAIGAAAPILGRAYRLTDIANALALLDEVESAVEGLYTRVVVRVAAGFDAWAYQCGDPALMQRPISGGDWLSRD